MSHGSRRDSETFWLLDVRTPLIQRIHSSRRKRQRDLCLKQSGRQVRAKLVVYRFGQCLTGQNRTKTGQDRAGQDKAESGQERLLSSALFPLVCWYIALDFEQGLFVQLRYSKPIFLLC